MSRWIICCSTDRPALAKTTLAGIIAAEMGQNIRITSGPAIEKAGDLASILTNLADGDVLFIDEIHRLSCSVEEVLYPAMEDYALDIKIGKGPTARSIRPDLPRFTLVGATTRAGASARRFATDSASSSPELYSPQELSAIVRRSAGFSTSAPTRRACWEIARRSRGRRASPTACSGACVTLRRFGPAALSRWRWRARAWTCWMWTSWAWKKLDRAMLTTMIDKFEAAWSVWRRSAP